MNLWYKQPPSPATDHRPWPQREDEPAPGTRAEGSLACGQQQAWQSREAGPLGGTGARSGRAGGTHIDEVVPVADEQVAQDTSLIQVPQADHVLHTVDRRGVHGLDVRGLLRGDPVFLREAQGLMSGCAPDPRLREDKGKALDGREPPVPATLLKVLFSLFSSSAKRHPY